MKFLVIAITVLFATGASAYDAPFGLTWGLSKDGLNRIVEGLSEHSDNNGIKTVVFESSPIDPSETYQYIGLIDKELGPFKVIWIGKSIEGDLYGSEGKEAFEKFQSIIKSNYELSEEFEFTKTGLKLYEEALKLYEEADEFYQCLAYDGCGKYVSVYQITGGGAISIELQGNGRGAGSFKLQYEAPIFSEVMKKSKEKVNSKNKNAF